MNSLAYLLIILHFDNYRFISTAFMLFTKMHSAGTASVTFFRENLNRIKMPHAIVVIENHSATESEVNKECYRAENLFHQQNKSNGKKGNIIMILINLETDRFEN